MKSISLLPNLLTLGGYFCGLLSIGTAFDALGADDPLVFYRKLETGCWLVLAAMVFDALDGTVARLMRATSAFGAQLDSLSDALTFGVAPALLAKVLIDHEGSTYGFAFHPRLVFSAVGIFAVMAVLRLARFNLESEDEAGVTPAPKRRKHAPFQGLPSPAAAGCVVATILSYLILREHRIETVDGSPTLVGEGLALLPELSPELLRWFLPIVLVLLPTLGFLMISRLPYAHISALLERPRDRFVRLVLLVVLAFVLRAAPVPMLFLAFVGYTFLGGLSGLLRSAPRSVSTNAESSHAGADR